MDTFNLEEAIQNWKNTLKKHEGLEPGYIEELEAHLRDKIEDLVSRGVSKEEAFRKAAKDQFENPDDVASEFFRARTQKPMTPPWKAKSWMPTMLPNYIKMALRSFKRQRQFALINTIGLSVGLACCLLIFLYTYHELQYDQFHPDSDQLYRITYQVSHQGSSEHYAKSIPGLAPALQQNFPNIASSIRLSSKQEMTTQVDQSVFKESSYFHADSSFFQVFGGYTLLHGNAESALKGPNKAVLSEETARKYFGDINPVGKTISVIYDQEQVSLEISGVASSLDHPSHFSFDILASFETLQNLYPIINDQNWWLRSVYTYLKVQDRRDAKRLQDRLPAFADKTMADMEQRSGSQFAFNLQPVTDIHLHSHLQQEIEQNGNIIYVYIFGTIALLILLIACINYMNLSTARYTQRAQEVGVRKSLGASRWNLIKQFIGESMLFTLFSILLAIVITWMTLPFLNHLAGKTIYLDALNLSLISISLAIIWVSAGIIAGSYPALFLSSFESTRVLKDTFSSVSSGAALRRGLVTFQFTISIILIAAAGVVYQQLNYAKNKPLGFEREQVLIIPNSDNLFANLNPTTIKQQLQSHSAVQQVAFASHYPSHVLSNNTRVQPQGAPEGAQYNITINNISPDYKEALKLDMLNGRDFSNKMASDTSAFVINQAAAMYFGWNQPIGKTLSNIESGEVLGRVIGVFKNFHVHSLHKKIEPMIFSMGPANRFEFTLVKFDGDNLASLLPYVKRLWQKMDPNQPFEYSFLDSQYESLYRSEQRLAKLIAVFSGLAVFIACLGLFGLAAFTAQQRTKEIGIRKVLGASISSIVQLLGKDFVTLVLLSLVIAIPVTWFTMSRWLQNFEYHIEVGPGVFMMAGSIVLIVTVITISWQSVKAALMNPVTSLRNQ